MGPLAEILDARGLSRLELASAVGCDLKTVRKIEKLDIGTLKLDSVVRVAQLLRVAPSDLIPALGVPPRRDREAERRLRRLRETRARVEKRIASILGGS